MTTGLDPNPAAFSTSGKPSPPHQMVGEQVPFSSPLDGEDWSRRANGSTRRAPTLRRNLAWAFAGNAAYAASQWGMLVLLAKLGRPAMLGQFALGLAIGAPVMIFANLALRPIQTTDARGRFAFGDYLGLRLLTTSMALVVIVVLALATTRNRETALVIAALGVAKAIESISDVFYGLLQRRERMDRVATSLLLKGPLSLAALGAGVWLTGSVFWGVLGLAVAWATVLVGYDLRAAAATATCLRPLWDGPTLRRLAWLALPLGIGTMLGSLNANVPRYAVERSWGEGELGLFAAMAYLTVAGNAVVAAMGQSASSRLARHFADGDARQFRDLLFKLLGIGGLLGALGIFVASVGGREFLTLLYRPEYARHAGAFRLLMVAAALDYLASLLGYGMTAAGAFRIQPFLFAAVAALNAGMSFILVPRYGVMGAASSLVVAGACQVSGLLAYDLRALQILKTTTSQRRQA